MSVRANSARSRWPRVRITPAGWLFSVITILVGLATVYSQPALMFVVFGVMLGAVLFSVLLSRRMVLAADVRRDMPERVWQNQTVHLAYALRNTRRRGACLGLNVEEISPASIESVSAYCVHLGPRSVFRAGARFVARRRGRIHLSGVRLFTRFPFGLVESSRRIDLPKSLVIWPALGQLKRRLLDRGAVETSSAAPSGATGGQDEFFGLREYREGDNPRWIHWRRSAACRVPVVREMAKPLPETLWVIVDTYWPDKLEDATLCREKLLRFAGTLIDHALSRGYLVGLALAYSDRARVLAPAEGRGQRSALLDALADADENTKIPLEDLLGRLARGQMRMAQVVLVAPDSQRLASAPLGGVRAECRSVTVITDKRLPEVFEDNPLAVAAENAS